MNNAVINISFLRRGEADLAVKAQSIVDAMTGNTSFASPTPTLATVQAAITRFNGALATAAEGGRALTAAKNAAKAELIGLLRSLALYVQQTCNGDMAMLLSSGFQARKSPQRAGVLPPPQWMTLATNNVSGRFHVRCKKVMNASSYEVQACNQPGAEEAWQDMGTYSSSRMVVVGFTPGLIYWVRVRGIGAAGPGGWCDPVSARAN